MKKENQIAEVAMKGIGSVSSFSPHPSSLLPVPNAPISVRLGTREDVPFIDALQKQYGKALGFFPRAQLEGYIDNGWMLIAEMEGSPVGFCASRDRYLKRDELGVIYQLCVSPNVQRGLIGASLIKAVFERSAYGCKLYCCWCAQDLAANRFWESLGFVPIAFRGGSAKKRVKGAGVAGRVHIFWQKRIRSEDHSTPWWFPAKTDGGAIREDRIVLPIPPGLHWSDPMPVMVAEPVEKAPRAKRAKKAVVAEPVKLKKPAMRFGPPGFDEIEQEKTPVTQAIVPSVETTLPMQTRTKVKVDPKLVAAARELRDRYLEQVNAENSPVIVGKYDVSKAIEAKTQKKLLAA